MNPVKSEIEIFMRNGNLRMGKNVENMLVGQTGANENHEKRDENQTAFFQTYR